MDEEALIDGAHFAEVSVRWADSALTCTLKLKPHSILVRVPQKPEVQWAYRDVIQCALEETSAGRRTLVLTLFQRHTDWFRGGDGFLEEKRFTVDGNTSSMQRWVAVVRQRACIPAQRKHILVILNPISGGGKSVDCLRKQLAPLIVASGHAYELVQCAYAGHAYDAAQQMKLSHIDCIVSIGGDGLWNEVCNGLHDRADGWYTQQEYGERPRICVIPTGTQNAIAASVGVRDVWMACLVVVKGDSCAMDGVRALPEQLEAHEREGYGSAQETASRLGASVLWGTLSDILADTAGHRWMGLARYGVCGARRLVRGIRQYRSLVSFVPVSGHEETLCVRGDGLDCRACALAEERTNTLTQASATGQSSASSTTSKDRPTDEALERLLCEQSRVTIDTPLAMVLIGAFPARTTDSRSARAFPYAHMSDGLLDVVIVRPCSAPQFLRFLVLTALTGRSQLDLPYVEHYKTREILVERHKSCIDVPFGVDGELAHPPGSLLMRVVPRAFKLGTPHARWADATDRAQGNGSGGPSSFFDRVFSCLPCCH